MPFPFVPSQIAEPKTGMLSLLGRALLEALVGPAGLLRGSPGMCTMTWGTGSPESVVTAPVGSLFLRTDGSAGAVVYSKNSGTGATGWGALS